MQETWVRSLSWEDLLEKRNPTHSSIPAWGIPWTVYSMGSQSWDTFEWLSLFKQFMWITTHCGKFLKRGEYQTTWPASWETYMQVKKKKQLKLDMEQWTSWKLGKEYVKAVYCHPAYLTYIQSTSCEMPGCMKLESRASGEISITSDMQMTPL